MLADDGQSVDARHVGYTVSNHENCAVELAIQIADAHRRLGDPADRRPRATRSSSCATRSALGCPAATLVEADPVALGPADVAREIAAVVEDHAANGSGYDLVLLGNDAADSGDFQVGIRLAYALGWPVVNGVRTSRSPTARVTRGDGPDGQETFAVPLPAVVTVLEGGVEPRYPTLKGRMKAKKIADRDPRRRPAAARQRPGAAAAAAAQPQQRRGAGRGRGRGRPWSTC